MKTFENPIVEIVMFEETDIITTSTGEESTTAVHENGYFPGGGLMNPRP